MEVSLKQVMHNMVRLVVENMICGSPCMVHWRGKREHKNLGKGENQGERQWQERSKSEERQ